MDPTPVDDNLDPSPPIKEVAVQTDFSVLDLYQLDKEVIGLNAKIKAIEWENNQLRERATSTTTFHSVMNLKPTIMKFYTGMENVGVFFAMLNFLLSFWKPITKVSLSPSEQFLLVLMKLRLGLKNQDLAVRFGIGLGSVSQIFHEWLDILFVNSQHLIPWS